MRRQRNNIAVRKSREKAKHYFHNLQACFHTIEFGKYQTNSNIGNTLQSQLTGNDRHNSKCHFDSEQEEVTFYFRTYLRHVVQYLEQSSLFTINNDYYADRFCLLSSPLFFPISFYFSQLFPRLTSSRSVSYPSEKSGSNGLSDQSKKLSITIIS